MTQKRVKASHLWREELWWRSVLRSLNTIEDLKLRACVADAGSFKFRPSLLKPRRRKVL